MRDLFIVSVDHQSHTSDERMALNLPDDLWQKMADQLFDQYGIKGCVHLRTCNRIELFIEANHDVSDDVIDGWLDNVSEKGLITKSSFNVYSGFEASIDHLLRLSIGFESAIFGDDQILSQLKKAFESARTERGLSTLLERAYQAIMRLHKTLCKETNFKSLSVSLAYQALKSARDVIGVNRLKTKKVLIIGAGDMAAQVVKYLPKFSFASVSITNRTLSKAIALARGTHIDVVSYQGLDVSEFDVIVSCTDQGNTLIHNWEAVAYYIDLSLSSTQLNFLPVPHVCLAELQQKINKKQDVRMKSVSMVRQFLDEGVKEFSSWCIAWQQRRRRKEAA